MYGKPRKLTKNDGWIKNFIETNKKINIKANIPTKILEIIPGRQEAFALPDKMPWLLKLIKEDNTQIAQDSSFAIALEVKNQMLKDQLTQDISYRPWFDIERTEQGNKDYIDNLRVSLGKNGNPADLLFEQLEKMVIYVTTSEDITLDWEKSFFEINSVEFNMDEIRAMNLENTQSMHYRR
jgi:hypothetical protein